MNMIPAFGRNVPRRPWGLGTGWFTAVSVGLHIALALAVFLIFYKTVGVVVPVEITEVCVVDTGVARSITPVVAGPGAEVESLQEAPPPPVDTIPEPSAEEAPAPEPPAPQETPPAEQTANEPLPDVPAQQGEGDFGRYATKCPGMNAEFFGTGDGGSRHGGGDENRLVPIGEKGGPVLIKFVPPEYPRFPMMMRIEGVVVVWLKLDETGTVVDMAVVKPAGYGFDEAAVDSVRRSVFGPATKDGVPVESQTLLPVRFQLDVFRRGR